MAKGIEVNFKPSIKQDRAWDYLTDTETLYVGYGGGAFSGKTYLLCYWLTINSLAYPDTAWGLARKELTTLKKTTLVTLFKVFEESNIVAGRDYNYNQQYNFIEFYNKSRIYLIDTAYKPSDPLYTRFGGLELTGAGVDESSESPHEAIKILFTRLGRKNNAKYGIKKKMLETFNPSKTHIYRRYFKPYRDGEELNGYRFVPALPKDNPSPEVHDYIKDILDTGDQVTIERLIHGNFEYDDDPSALIDQDSILSYFNPTHLTQGSETFLTIDVARKGKDKTVFRVWRGWVCVKREDIAVSKVTEVADRAKVLQKEFKIPLSNVVADEDGVGGGVVDILNCKGFVNNSTALNGENYDNLKSQCSMKMAQKISNKEAGEVCKDDRVKDLVVEEMEQVKQKDIDKEGKRGIVSKDKVKEILGRSPDDWDSIMMRYYFELNPRIKVRSSSLNGHTRR